MCLMLQGGVMFGAVIIQIRNHGIPVVTKSIMIISTAEPVEAHVHGFGEFGNNGFVFDPISCRVFRLEG